MKSQWRSHYPGRFSQAYEAVKRAPLKSTFKGIMRSIANAPPSFPVVLPWSRWEIWMRWWYSLRFGNLTPLLTFPFGGWASARLLPIEQNSGDPSFHPENAHLSNWLQGICKATVWKSRFDEGFELVTLFRSMGQLYVGDHTTHFSNTQIPEGNASSMTYTLENSYGVAMGSDKLGFIFNNEMGWLQPFLWMNYFLGQICSDQTCKLCKIACFLSMNPTIVKRKMASPYLVDRSPGGRTIKSYRFQNRPECLSLWHAIDACESKRWKNSPPVASRSDSYMKEFTFAWYAWMWLRKNGPHSAHDQASGVLMGITYDANAWNICGAADSASEDGAARGILKF